MITATDKYSIARYVAYLAQDGTNDPTATILYNTIGTITIDRISTGRYHLLSSTGEFKVGKTVANRTFTDNALPMMLATASAYTYLVQTNILGANTIEIAILNATTLAYTDLSTVGPITIPINIEVFNYITPTT